MCNSAEPSDSQSVQSTNCYLQNKIHAYSCYSHLLVNHLYRRVRITRPPPLDTRAHPHSWCTLTQCCPDHWKRHRWRGPCLVHARLVAADRYQNSQCCSLPTWKTTLKFPTNSTTHSFLLEQALFTITYWWTHWAFLIFEFHMECVRTANCGLSLSCLYS